MTDLAIAFDIGGTKTRVGTIANNAVGEVRVFPTAPDPEEGTRAVSEAARALVSNASLNAVCGCVAGSVVEGVVVGANNLVLWNGFPIMERFKEAFGAVPLAIMNDAELAGLGEFFYGAGMGFEKILYVTVSTGVGRARIAAGRIVQENDPVVVGQELIDLLALEHSVSGTAVKNTYGVDPKDLTNEAIRETLADRLASGLKNSVSAFRPDALVLGGSMITGQNSIPLDRVQRQISVPVKMATLDSLGGLWGAVAYFNQKGTSG